MNENKHYQAEKFKGNLVKISELRTSRSGFGWLELEHG